VERPARRPHGSPGQPAGDKPHKGFSPMFRFDKLLHGLRRRQRGASALEYALLLAFVAVGVLAGINTLSTNVKNTMTSVGRTVTAAPGKVK
jgi:Flp pilus assembly pilin Flp